MVAAAKLERDKALWDVQQTTIVSPVNAKVFDIIYRAGERPSAGKPIISLLPPENIKKYASLYPKRSSVNLKSDLR